MKLSLVERETILLYNQAEPCLLYTSLSLKSDFILSLCELIVGGKDGLPGFRSIRVLTQMNW